MSLRNVGAVWCAFLLLLLTACGASTPNQTPAAPGPVAVTPGPGVLHVSWFHDGESATEYIVYREARDGSGRTELARVPKRSGGYPFYSYMDEEAEDETAVRYLVAAVGPGGSSEAALQVDGVPAADRPLPLCSPPDTGATTKDSDSDGISDRQETTGWTVSTVSQTASPTGVGSKLQRTTVSQTVTSDPTNPDTDGDGLCDSLELHYRTDARSADTDQDGLIDFEELFTWVSDPNNLDSDNDAFAPVLFFDTQENQQRVGELTLSRGRPELFDGSEVGTYRTSPTLADTDGDSYSDYDEIIDKGSSFDPRVANLPQLELSLVGTVVLVVDIAYSDSTQQAETKSASLEQGQSSSNTTYQSNVRKVWHKYDQSISGGAGKDSDGWSFSVKAKVSFEEGSATTTTNGSSKTSLQSAQQTYNDAVQTSREQGRTISGGSISLGVRVKNAGDITYTLSDLAVTALQRDPEDPSSFKTIATLTLEPKGISLDPNAQTGTLEASADLPADVILGLLANPSSLLFEIGSFSISNAQNIDYNFLEQVTDNQTGLIVVDFGDGNVISKRVATNVVRAGGKITGITLGDALDTLGLEFQTQTRVVEGSSVSVLTSITDPATGSATAANSADNSFWVALQTADATGPVARDFEDIVLEAGKAAYLLYVTDQDEDGLYLRDETLYGTLDIHKDTDGDGRSDRDEVLTGWLINARLPPLFPGTVYSSPVLADADQDGLDDSQELSSTTDPNNPDTDSDLLCDGGGSALNPTGVCMAGVTPDPEPLNPRLAVRNLAPQAYAVDADPKGTIAVTASLPLTTTSRFSVRSLGRGNLGGTFAFGDGGRTLTFTPELPLVAGEEIEVQLLALSSSSGKKLAPYTYRFRTATTKSSGTVANPTDYATEGVPFTVVSGDFNGDGRLDLAVGNYPQTLSVLLANPDGSGTFLPRVDYPLPAAPVDMATGDFDGDGRLDLIMTNEGDDTVSVLLAGAIVGTFQPGVTYEVGGGDYLTVGDFNGDGILDVAEVDGKGDGKGVSLLFGKGDGTFHPYVDITLSGTFLDIVTEDFDLDGRLDLAIVGETASSAFVSVLLADPSKPGSFKPAVVSSLVRLGLVASGDFDGDGYPDLAVTNLAHPPMAEAVQVLLNDSARPGSFKTDVGSYPAGGQGITTNDLNGDGRLDLATTSTTSDALSVLLAAPTPGRFEPNASYSYPQGSLYTIFTGDFNADGKIDLVTTDANNGTVSVWLGQP